MLKLIALSLYLYRIYPSKVSYLNNLVICTIIDKTETVGRSSVHFNLNIDFFLVGVFNSRGNVFLCRTVNLFQLPS